MSTTIAVLKHLIHLEETRTSLRKELAELDSVIDKIKRGLVGTALEISAPVVKPKGKPGRPPGSKNVVKATSTAAVAPKASAKPKGKTAKGFQRGALVDSIRAALKEAGAKGASIKDLAAKLKSEYRNIQVWFATTGKKHKDIKKIAPATYRLK